MSHRAPSTVARMDAVLAVLRDAAGEPISCMAICDFTGTGHAGYQPTYQALCHLERDGLARRATWAERSHHGHGTATVDFGPDATSVEWVATNRTPPSPDDLEAAWSLPAAEVER